MALHELTATQAVEAIRNGELSSEELVRACLAHIEEQEENIGAWAHIDREFALQQARDADAKRRAGEPLGALHGVPIGVKDIFDTADYPTEDGTVLHAGRTPAHDATAVARLRAAGGIVLGKTVTAELAVCTPGKTRNPHNADHTPGGSSSGSAAAVAAGMVPLAIGTQTNGSVIRPASYCGVVGYKPTFGTISRYRVLRASRALDQVGVFTRTLEDAAVLARQLMGHDGGDPDTRPRAYADLRAMTVSEPPVRPTLAMVRTPAWTQGDEDMRSAMGELRDFLGAAVEAVDLDDLLGNAVEIHRTIMEADIARSFKREYERGRDRLSPALCEIIERGQAISAVDYNDAVAAIPGIVSGLDEILLEYDAILTPAATGEAPAGLDSTGDPVFSTPWSLAGTPAVSLPLLQGETGLPIGVQLVAGRGDDGRLLRTANWLVGQLAAE